MGQQIARGMGDTGGSGSGRCCQRQRRNSRTRDARVGGSEAEETDRTTTHHRNYANRGLAPPAAECARAVIPGAGGSGTVYGAVDGSGRQGTARSQGHDNAKSGEGFLSRYQLLARRRADPRSPSLISRTTPGLQPPAMGGMRLGAVLAYATGARAEHSAL